MVWRWLSWRRKCRFGAHKCCLHAVLLPLCFFFQGCSFITIKYCDGFDIHHGRILGAWQHDLAVVKCDDGYEYTGIEVTCEEFDQNCTRQDGNEICKPKVGMTLKADVVQEFASRRLKATGLPEMWMRTGGMENTSDSVELSQPTQTVLLCMEKTRLSKPQSTEEVTSERHRGRTSEVVLGVTKGCTDDLFESKQIQQWVHDYFLTWNTHNASGVAACFARDGQERLWSRDAKGQDEVAKANAEVFRKLPNITIKLLAVQAFPASNAALAKVSIRTGENQILATKDWDFMEFDTNGLLKSMRGSLATISRTISRSMGEDGTILKIKGLPTNGNVLYLYKVFAPFGAIRDAKVEVNEDGTCKGDGHVEFAFAADAEQASKMLKGKNPADVRDPSLKPLPSDSKAVLQVSIVTKGKAEELPV